MKKYVPDYYNKFLCTADKCHHNCCIGWEIDIDDDTLAYYKSVGGEFGKRLCENIVTEENGTSHFCLGEDERCPFLNDRNLCDIYTELGADGFCQICDDHPRFRNYYSEREELGLGLSCEAAGKLILSHTEPAQLVCIEEDDEGEFLWEEECDFLDFRDDIFDILQNRTKHISRRVEDMLKYCQIEMPHKTTAQWAETLLGLERLDKQWDVMLEKVKNSAEATIVLPFEQNREIAFEQLVVYLAYRHLADSLDDDRLAERVKFVALGYQIVYALCAVQYAENGKLTVDDMVEICRMYSSEIEYKDDNIEALLDALM